MKISNYLQFLNLKITHSKKKSSFDQNVFEIFDKHDFYILTIENSISNIDEYEKKTKIVFKFVMKKFNDHVIIV